MEQAFPFWQLWQSHDVRKSPSAAPAPLCKLQLAAFPEFRKGEDHGLLVVVRIPVHRERHVLAVHHAALAVGDHALRRLQHFVDQLGPRHTSRLLGSTGYAQLREADAQGVPARTLPPRFEGGAKDGCRSPSL